MANTTETSNQSNKSSLLTEGERAALRVYLQRCEVRLSTMHRIAGNFLGGAGLLALFPAFLQNAFLKILEPILVLANLRPVTSSVLLVALMVELVLPAYALYLVLKEIINFYFTPTHPGQQNRFFHPRFVLSGLTPPVDEVEEDTKEQIYYSEQKEDMMHFVLPHTDRELEYYQSILDQTAGEIIPETRRRHREKGNRKVDYLYTAFGLAGVVDRTLVDEVAKMEASLVRHALNLRRLLLRYTKSLLMFIWTTLLFSVLAGFIGSENRPAIPLDNALLLAIAFGIWGILTPIIIRLPIRWIYALESQNREMSAIRRDKQLVEFETHVTWTSWGVIFLALVAAILHRIA